MSKKLTPKDYWKFFKNLGLWRSVILLATFVFYRLKYMRKDEERAGYFMVKRKWVWFLLAPLVVPLCILVAAITAIADYIKFIYNYKYHWIADHDKKLSLAKRLVYRKQLWF